MSKSILIFKQFFFNCYLPFSLLLASCANIVAPTGGTKDIIPPKVLKAEPENKSTHFTGNTIRLYFDEYVQLKDESRVMLISPPPDKLPEAKIKGKSVVLTLPGTLQENTTYTIQFGTAIQDFNEGNPLTDYTYVFSTGNVIDSLSVDGKVIKADNLTGVPKALVFLYANTKDSVIFTEKPRYLARTDDNGNFRLDHIAGGKYKMIALKDDNTDLLASLPAEEIAFPDSLIQPLFTVNVPDTNRKDSLIKNNSISRPVILYLFKERDSSLRFQKAYFEKPYQLILPFSLPVKNLEIIPIGSSNDLGTQWYIPEWSKNHDTLTCWVKSSVSKDSLNFRLSADKKIIDTVRLDMKRYGKGGKYRKDRDKTAKLNVVANVNSTITPEDVIVFSFSYPLLNANLDEVKLLRPKDTIRVKTVFLDSLKRHLQLKYSWEENSAYQVVFPKGILTDWTNQTNDSLVFKLGTRALQDYGKLLFHFEAKEPGQYILQLLDQKDQVVKETVVQNSGNWTLNYLTAGKYRVKAIQDKNNNSHWDSGNYRFKIQPERVSFYPKTLELRGNWDLEETWKW